MIEYGYAPPIRREALLNGARIIQALEAGARVFTNGGNLTATASYLHFDDGAGNGVGWLLFGGDALKNLRTLEVIRLSSAPATNTGGVYVVRGFALSGVEGDGQDLRDGDEWEIL